MSAGREERPDGSYVTSARGLEVPQDPLLNMGTAFTPAERTELGLAEEGLAHAELPDPGRQARDAMGRPEYRPVRAR